MKVGEIVKYGAQKFGIDLPDGSNEAFEKYHAVLEKHRRKVNLTAVTGGEDIAKLLFLDSLALLRAAKFKDARVIDIGSGAGFPGIPIKIAEPTIRLTMIDATAKRVEFLSGLCATLRIDAECIHARAEELSRTKEMREQYEIAVSRAVARMDVLCELCLPFVSVGGMFLAMKTMDSNTEIGEAAGALRILGAEIEGFRDYTIPDTQITRRIIQVRKTAMTPEKYPRRFAKLKKVPISTK